MALNGKVVSSSGNSHNETRGLINNQPKLLHFISSNFLLLKNVEIYRKGMHVRATDDGRITRNFLNHAACLNQTYKRSKKKILIAEHKGEKKSSIIRGIFSNLYLIIVPLCSSMSFFTRNDEMVTRKDTFSSIINLLLLLRLLSMRHVRREGLFLLFLIYIQVGMNVGLSNVNTK